MSQRKYDPALETVLERTSMGDPDFLKSFGLQKQADYGAAVKRKFFAARFFLFSGLVHGEF